MFMRVQRTKGLRLSMGPTSLIQKENAMTTTSENSFEIDIDDALIQEDVEQDVFASSVDTQEHA